MTTALFLLCIRRDCWRAQRIAICIAVDAAMVAALTVMITYPVVAGAAFATAVMACLASGGSGR